MNLVNHQNAYPLPPRILQRMEQKLREYVQRYGLRSATVVLVDDAYITTLNQQFLGRPRPTNVLAFDLGDEAEVYVSTETTAREFGPENLVVGLLYYAVHGLLHLSGYDHKVRSRAAEMERLQQEVLADLEATFSSKDSAGA